VKPAAAEKKKERHPHPAAMKPFVRVLGGNDGSFFDVHYASDPVVTFPNNRTCELVYPDGSTRVLPGPYLLIGVPFDDGMLTMDDLVHILNLAPTLPSAVMMTRFQFPRTLLNPSVGIELGFDIPRQESRTIQREGARIIQCIIV
jgi:hypothetical protein